MPIFKMQIISSLMFRDSLMASALFKKNALRLGSSRAQFLCVVPRRANVRVCRDAWCS
jgi:hypothetical protein